MPTMTPLTRTSAGRSLGDVSWAVRRDWLVMLLPAAYCSLRSINTRAFVGALALLVLLTFVQQDRSSSRALAWGPFAMLVGAAGIVFANPEPGPSVKVTIVTAVLLSILAIRIATTTDARSLIVSLIDGIGIYLLINVVGHLAGVSARSSADRVGGVSESTGFTRVFFPFSSALDAAPTMAAAFIAAAPILIRSDKRWRLFRIICLLAGVYVAWFSGSRTALIIAATMSVLGLLAPSVLRWLAPASAVFSAISAVLLPSIMKIAADAVAPIAEFLAPGRDTGQQDIASLSNRDLIWSQSLQFWSDHVYKLHDQLLGFGQTGQYRSGASMSYAGIVTEVSRSPLRATLHNSFLQQLFDGGLIGWLLLLAAFTWAAVRYSQRIADWGREAHVAILALSALLFASNLSVALAPGFLQEGFIVAIVLVAASCQLPTGNSPESSPEGSANHGVPARRRTSQAVVGRGQRPGEPICAGM